MIRSKNVTKDEEDRRLAEENINTSYIVEAAAGTGKTNSLIKRVLNLVKNGKRLDRIVAITFTEKAAADLKEKLQKELTAQNDENCKKAISLLEKMHVSTIHSFCASLLRERPVEAKIDPNFEIADELMASILKEEVWDEWLEKTLNTDDPAIRNLLEKEVKIERVSEFKSEVLENYHLLEEMGVFNDDSIDEKIRKFIKSHATADEKKKENKENTNNELLLGMIIKLGDYVNEYRRAKRERNFLDFDDILLITRNLLKSNIEVREYFKEKFDCLLVDEFQDTDPLQTEIVFFLAEKKGKSAENWDKVEIQPGRLFIVGDPKQSIYRFRRADVEMYEEAKNVMGGENILFFSKNFRCAKSIVDGVNSRFRETIKKPKDGNYQPTYVELEFGRKEGSIPPENGIIHLIVPADENEDLNKDYKKQYWESIHIGAFIKKIIEEKWQICDKNEKSRDKNKEIIRPVELKDIVILVRSNYLATPLEKALQLYGIDYKVVEGKTFYQRVEIESLITVLKAIENPNDEVSIVGALRSPFFGVSDEEIFLFRENGGKFDYLKGGEGTGFEAQFSLLKEFYEKRNILDIPELLNKLYERTGILSLYYMEQHGKQKVLNLLKIADIARALKERGIGSFRGFVRWLDKMRSEEVEERESPYLEEDENLVKVMTIHKAKGLEFPVVFLPFLGSQCSNKNEKLIIDKENKELAIGINDRIKTENYNDKQSWDKKRSSAEEERIRYVAMTRARDFLAISLLDDVNSQEIIKIPPDYMKRYDGSELNIIRERSYSVLQSFLPEMKKKSPQERFRAKEEWERSLDIIRNRSREGLNIKTPTEMVEKDEWYQVYKISGHDDGARFGLFIHSLLEKIDWENPQMLEKIAFAEGREKGMDEAKIREGIELVRNTLKSSLIKRVIDSKNYQKEVPFSFEKNGVIYEGVMDLVFKEGDGLFVVDFKTDSVNKNNLQEKIEHYRPQLNIYSDAIETIFNKKAGGVYLFFVRAVKVASLD